MPDLTLFHRNPQGALLAVRPLVAAEWTRRFSASGSFQAQFTLEHGSAIACGDNLDFQLDGRLDFSGIVQRRTLSYREARPPTIEIEGLDLTWWLHQRIIVPPAAASHDEQIDVAAEDAIRHYITDHLLQPTDTTRAIDVPAALATVHSPALGPQVHIRARYINLARQIERIAVQAGLGLAATRDDQDVLQFAVVASRDRRSGSADPILISPHQQRTAELLYVEDAIRHRNAVYVLGEGNGVTRLVETVLDSGDIDVRGRRELALDAREAADSDAATDAGTAELARQAATSQRVDAVPLIPASPIAGFTYRDDWDIGDLVTVDLPDLNLTIDRRIDSVRITFDPGEPIRIDTAFGAPRPDATALLRQIDERTTPTRFV